MAGTKRTRRSCRLNSRDSARWRVFATGFAPRFPMSVSSTPQASPVGFSVLKGDELYQLFVSAQARGSGVAAALIADAELRFRANGVETAWLACAIGNERAARFYQKCGWHRVGTMLNQVETSAGTFPLDVWRYEKRL